MDNSERQMAASLSLSIAIERRTPTRRCKARKCIESWPIPPEFIAKPLILLTSLFTSAAAVAGLFKSPPNRNKSLSPRLIGRMYQLANLHL